MCRGPWGRGTSPGLRGGRPARMEGKRGMGAGEADPHPERPLSGLSRESRSGTCIWNRAGVLAVGAGLDVQAASGSAAS